MRTKIIAEVGSNHNGDMGLAKRMVGAAAEAGADYVKFQSWQTKNMRKGDKDYEYFRQRELSDEDHHALIAECKKSGIGFLTTCSDIGRIGFIKGLGLDAIKVASPDAGSHKMIGLLKGSFKSIIISTGMAYEEEIKKTAEILRGTDFTFLHCVSAYPAPPEKVNMSRMDWLRMFTPSVGFSDHTIGTEAAKLAIAKGASIVEKHFTVDKTLPGKIQALCAGPAEIGELAAYSRLVEKMMGGGSTAMLDEERAARDVWVNRWGCNR